MNFGPPAESRYPFPQETIPEACDCTWFIGWDASYPAIGDKLRAASRADVERMCTEGNPEGVVVGDGTQMSGAWCEVQEYVFGREMGQDPNRQLVRKVHETLQRKQRVSYAELHEDVSMQTRGLLVIVR